jgi:hypothetical protein
MIMLVIQTEKQFPLFMELEDSLTYLPKFAIGPFLWKNLV